MSLANLSLYPESNLSAVNATYGGGIGAPEAMKVIPTSENRVQIKPLQEATLGYGLGNALNRGFNRVYPVITNLFNSVVNNLPPFSLFNIQGASAAEIPYEEHTKQKRQMVEGVRKVCNFTEVGKCDLRWPNVEGITIDGGFAYLASNDGYLTIVNVKNPSNPYQEGYWGYQRWAAESPPGILNKQAYMGYFRHGLQVINVENPSNPYLTGYYNGSLGAELADVKAQGNSVYLDANFVGGGTFSILNVTDPSTPYLEGIYKFPHDFNVVSNFEVTKTHAFIGTKNGFFILSIANPKKPILTVHYGDDSITDVAVAGNTAYLIEIQRFQSLVGLHSVDISDPENPSSADFIEIYLAEKVAIMENHAFVISRDEELKYKISAIDISDPYNLTISGSFQFSDNRTMTGIAVSGGFAYVGGHKRWHGPGYKPFSVLKVKCT